MYDPHYHDADTEVLKKRIAELEAEVTSQKLIEQNLIRYCKDHKTRIAELEAQLERVRGLQSYSVTFVDQKTRLRITRQVVDADKLQAILEKVNEH